MSARRRWYEYGRGRVSRFALLLALARGWTVSLVLEQCYGPGEKDAWRHHANIDGRRISTSFSVAASKSAKCVISSSLGSAAYSPIVKVQMNGGYMRSVARNAPGGSASQRAE